ncbi:biotin--[acetyl-CoA-carboxylase] ligase [Yaniella flava]|uniref:biotin--[biotin carboxyl-carrier protein] ligase n=1 Tax=Yaniella flava TaxID=287930 RepID=A0ABP5FDS1_9MICC
MAQAEHQWLTSEVYWMTHVGSTQDVMINAAADFQHGDVVATDQQTAGRGRLDRSWDTPPGTAAAMSVMLRPHVATHLLGMMTLVVADGLVRWFRELDLAAGVKWPNDVLAPDGKKLCGILAQWIPEQQAVVIGIGTNIDFGQHERLTTAGALADYGVVLTPQEFVVAARHRIVAAVDAFVAEPDAKSLESTMSTIGQRVKALLPDGNDVTGTAVGLGPTGSLLIQGETIQEIFAGDIVHLRPA